MVGGLFLLLSGIAIAAISLPWTWLFFGGTILSALGLAFGVPAGAYYHVALYRELSRGGPAPSRWWISPTRYHAELDDEAMERVRPWFVLGGSGFGLIILGILIAILGAVVGRQ